MKYFYKNISFLFLVLFMNNSLVIAEINHDYEKTNRTIHNFNDAIDQNFLKPTSKVYGVLPDFVEIGISNAISNINEPSNIFNYLSQGNIPSGVYSLSRFLVNSTIGLVGFFDVAGNIGLEKNATDFGKTLEKWGVEEGQFLVVPFLGPRTSRHLFGTIVDIGLNPIRYALKDEDTIVSFSPSIVYALSERSRNGDTIDNLRETSIDYYSTLRSIYLQSREINIVNNFEEDQDIFENDFEEFYESKNDNK
jgi:phospholipid-binding lipoprotein MlaA